MKLLCSDGPLKNKNNWGSLRPIWDFGEFQEALRYFGMVPLRNKEIKWLSPIITVGFQYRDISGSEVLFRIVD